MLFAKHNNNQIKSMILVGVCRAYDIRNIHNNVVGKPKGNIQFGKHDIRLRNNIKKLGY